MDIAARVLTEGKDKVVFESGNYTESGGGLSYGAYLVNGPESYIAGGVDRLDAAHTRQFEGFDEKVRWDFRRPAERSLFGILRRFVRRGGPGSGHFGHDGRPGQRRGSLPGDETSISEYRLPREPEEPPTGKRKWNPTISITKSGEVRKFVASKMSEALGRPISVRTGKVEEMRDNVNGRTPSGVVFTDDTFMSIGETVL